MITILLIILVIALVVGLPISPYPIHQYGYAPSSILAVVLVVILVLFLLGRI